MTMGSPEASAASLPGVEEMNASWLPSGDQKTRLVRDTPFESERLSVGRPQRAAGGVLLPADARGFLCSQIHHPELTVGAPRAVAHHDRVCNATGIRRELGTANGSQA